MHLARAGKKVVLAEHGGIGGQCLHYGCMVVCALSDVASTLRSASFFAKAGITRGIPEIKFPELLIQLKEVQGVIASVLDEETRGAGVEVRHGCRGVLSGRDVFLNGECIETEAVLIATGSRPMIPEIPGIHIPGVVSAHTLGSMTRLPQRLAIIGGGVMAAEFASIFHAFGSEVTIYSRSRFLRQIDPLLRTCALKDLTGVMIKEEIHVTAVLGKTRVEGIEFSGPGGTEVSQVDTVFVAAGLEPNSDMIEGVAKGPSREVLVDARQETSVQGVYAAGDVTGPPCLTPVARREGYVAAENILGHAVRLDLSCIPQALSLSLEHGSAIRTTDGMASVTVPGPAGPGTFWQVISGETGVAKVFFSLDDGSIGAVLASAPASGITTAYLGHMIRRGAKVQEFTDFMEVHPMADGAYGLLKYAAAMVKKHQGDPGDQGPPA